MLDIKTMLTGAALAGGSMAAQAHEESGWAAIHWHASDFLGLAVVGVLAGAALWLGRRPKRGACKEKNKP